MIVSGRPPRPPAHFCWEPQVCIKSSWNFQSIIGKCIKINVESVHFSVTTLFKNKTTFEVTGPPARAYHHVMAMGGTVHTLSIWGTVKWSPTDLNLGLEHSSKSSEWHIDCTKLKFRSQSKLLAKKYMAALRAVLKPMAYQWSWGSCRQMSGRKISRSDPIRFCENSPILRKHDLFDPLWPQIWPDQKIIQVLFVELTAAYRTPFTACRYLSYFSSSLGGRSSAPPPALRRWLRPRPCAG